MPMDLLPMDYDWDDLKALLFIVVLFLLLVSFFMGFFKLFMFLF